MIYKKLAVLILSFILVTFTLGCVVKEIETIDRESKIPLNAVKVTPETDLNPPKSHSLEYNDPVHLPYSINTRGGEDSAFIMPDGETLYFWFTPDVNIPAEKQLIDGVTGIYVSRKSGDIWSKPERIILQDPKKLALDGCSFVKDNTIWFCSAREGYSGINWFTAEFDSSKNKWQNWKKANFKEEYEIGELHIEGDELYFHSSRVGGKGGLDIWIMEKDSKGEWSEPINLSNVNTERNEGWPAISPDGKELWISKDYGLWRSRNVNGKWSEPELMISPLAGEASIDAKGNVYFTHHFFKDGKMIEADIYVAYKK